MRNLRVIQGKSIEDNILSIDGLLESILRKQIMIEEKMNKKNAAQMPFTISGYIKNCQSGDVVCAYLSLTNINLARAVIVVDKLAKDAIAYIDIVILSDTGKETSVRYRLVQGINSVEEKRSIIPGDKVSLLISYPDTAPEGIWVAMRGDRA